MRGCRFCDEGDSVCEYTNEMLSELNASMRITHDVDYEGVESYYIWVPTDNGDMWSMRIHYCPMCGRELS